MSQVPETYNRRLAIRTVPMPSDLNMNGNIFGGWVLSQMDIAGGIAAFDVAGRVATVAVESMTFIHPILAGDVVSLYTKVENIGTTSVTISIDVFAQTGNNEPYLVTNGRYIFVAVDEEGKKRAIEQS